MSGIVGLLNLDDVPVDQSLLGSLTTHLGYCGPDRQDFRTQGRAGLGHAMLATTFEAAREEQPCSLDGEVWITADARIDDRDQLTGRLRAKGREVAPDATDVELILHAYHVWREDCVEYLIGDFAFVLWDSRRQRLFCARDQFGVIPPLLRRGGQEPRREQRAEVHSPASVRQR